jgi:hypothetical protein
MATTPRGVAVATVLAQAQLKYAEPSGRQSCCETVPSAPDSSHACLSLKTSHACVCSNKTQPAPSPQHSLSVSQRGPSTRHDDAAHDLDKATRRARARTRAVAGVHRLADERRRRRRLAPTGQEPSVKPTRPCARRRWHACLRARVAGSACAVAH